MQKDQLTYQPLADGIMRVQTYVQHSAERDGLFLTKFKKELQDSVDRQAEITFRHMPLNNYEVIDPRVI